MLIRAAGHLGNISLDRIKLSGLVMVNQILSQEPMILHISRTILEEI